MPKDPKPDDKDDDKDVEDPLEMFEADINDALSADDDATSSANEPTSDSSSTSAT